MYVAISLNLHTQPHLRMTHEKLTRWFRCFLSSFLLRSQAESPDDCSAVCASLRFGSDMEEGAFTAILGKSIQMHPGFKVAHVPSQLLCSWAMLEENAADEAMHSWCLQYRTSLLDSACLPPIGEALFSLNQIE
jgi:hypothetical protein